jgi:6-methylsalicylate decarboxylase
MKKISQLVNRRKFLRAACLATAAPLITVLEPGLAAAQSLSDAQQSIDVRHTMTRKKIDTHQHFFPPAYVEAVGMDVLATQMPNKKAPNWSADLAISMMDANGIGEGILSVSSVPRLPKLESILPRLLRGCNETAADLRARHPGRFGSFANLPLPDIDASLKEIAHSVDNLRVDGFIIFASYDGLYLGDPHFAPLLEELDRRRAVVLIHPNDPTYAVPNVAPTSVLEFPFETTRTATSLILAGAMSRYSGIRFILSHAGGTLPFLLPRIEISVSMIPGAAERVGNVREAVRKFYFDTALSAGPTTFAALSQIADPTHILFGTDFPMAPLRIIESMNGEIGALHADGLSIPAIERNNAAALLGRSPAA